MKNISRVGLSPMLALGLMVGGFAVAGCNEAELSGSVADTDKSATVEHLGETSGTLRTGTPPIADRNGAATPSVPSIGLSSNENIDGNSGGDDQGAAPFQAPTTNNNENPAGKQVEGYDPEPAPWHDHSHDS